MNSMSSNRDTLMEEIKKYAPERGRMYALYTNCMEYCAYNMAELLQRQNLAENLLELHLFDTEKEYRFVQKRKGCISKLIDDSCIDSEKGECTYEEGILTLDSQGIPGRVTVVNYITYDEDDLLYIENYRLKEVD